MKRLLDATLALAGLVLLAPVFAAVAIAVKCDGGGSVLFRQERVGRNFRPFRIFKFRTMVPDAASKGPGITVNGDARITRIGGFLRWSKLDELPQLVNVLRGEMSFVGPRPELPEYVRRFEDAYREILRVRPGITDPASLTYRDEAERLAQSSDPMRTYVEVVLPEKIELAKRYAERASVLGDLRIIVSTVLVLLYPVRRIESALNRLGSRHGALAVLVQVLLAAIANAGAVLLASNGAPSEALRLQFLVGLPFLLPLRALCFWWFHLERDLWRYVSLRELGALAGATALGSLLFYAVTLVPGALAGYPPTVLIVDAILCFGLLAGVRVLRRVHRELGDRVVARRRALVVGAGDMTERVLRGLIDHPRHAYEVVGLVGEDAAKVGLQIHSVPFIGSFAEIDGILQAERPDEVVIVAPSLSEKLLKDTVRASRACGGAVRVVREEDEARNGGQRLLLEEPDAEDLLFRDPVEVDAERLRSVYRGRRVLVTGAGGSIGSEICRQIAACEPEALVLFEKHEASLYHIERELRAKAPGVALEPVLGDVIDGARVGEVLERLLPDTIFHAAAYKHVPMLEKNPIEGFKTNALGTMVVAEAAHQAGVGKFVLISTDKAVDPVSILGVSKRMAELTVQGLAAKSETRFMAVRFGNVLESSGSVVPLFKEQIEQGGPVTVTHPHATRWFMTVPESVSLILEAARMGAGGELFVLDMGRPVRILDLAHALIRSYGLVPERDVRVVFTGMRPGERLFEKLFNDHEVVWKTPHPRILKTDDAGDARSSARRAEELTRLLRVVDHATAAAISEREIARLVGELETACA
jgi:FlaA1/EpsC-like NDP-sugar epimerase/lipopolysaccharide/colanic/teichoic acid biosynthesis glycosyltransferase